MRFLQVSELLGKEACRVGGTFPGAFVSIVETDSSRQMKEVIEENLDEIIAVHESVHRGKPLSSLPSLSAFEDRSSLSSLHGYPAFRASIESDEAFLRRQLNVVFSLAADAFRPKRVSR